MTWLKLVVATLPVLFTDQWGKLKLVSSEAGASGHEVTVEYVDDTDEGVDFVHLECELIDYRNALVSSDRVLISAPGREAKTLHLVLRDAQDRGRRVECRLAGGKHKAPAAAE